MIVSVLSTFSGDSRGLSLDPEGVVLDRSDDRVFVSEEYGPDIVSVCIGWQGSIMMVSKCVLDGRDYSSSLPGSNYKCS